MSHLDSEELLSFYEYGLRKNPFKPAIADQRDPEEIILEGTQYMNYVLRVKHEIETIEHNTSTVILVSGKIGMGKTAVIKRALYEVGHKISVGKDIHSKTLTIKNKKVLSVYIRAPQQEAKFLEILSTYVIEELKKYFREEKIKINEENFNATAFAQFLNMLCKQQKLTGIVLAFDQLERLEENSLIESVHFLRELYNSKSFGAVLILSSTREEEIKSLHDSLKGYVGNIVQFNITGLKEDEVITLIPEILQYYRIQEPLAVPSPQDKKYYPFTYEGIKVILDSIYKTEKLERIAPRTIYDILGNILDEAIVRGLIPINDDRAQSLLGIVGIYRIEWLEALNEPYYNFNDAINTLFKFISIYIKRLLIDGELKVSALINIGSLDEKIVNQIIHFQNEAKVSEILNNIKKALSVIVYVDTLKGPYVYLIKYGRWLTRAHIENLINFLAAVQGFKVGGRIIGMDRVLYKLITLDSLPSTVEERLGMVSAVAPVTVAEPWVIDSQDPQSYGVLMTLYRRIQVLGFAKAREDEVVRTSLLHLVKRLFNDIIELE